MPRPRLKQLSQDGATDGQLLLWDNAADKWKPDAFLHAAKHIRTGTDEIDGDKIDIDFTPTYYTPDVTPAEVTHVDELTAHLAGIDNLLANAASAIQLNPGEAIVPGVGSGASKVVANDYSATEHQQGKTSIAAYSVYLPKTPGSDVTLTVKFILKASGTGTIVRVAAKIKSRATGEDSSTAFDVEDFDDVTVTTTTIGEIFEGVITIAAATFANNDIAAFSIGRDGNNEIAGGGASDDYNKNVQIIGIQVTVP